AVSGDRPEQLLLAGITPVHGADPHAGPGRHRGDGCLGVGDEHGAGGVKDPAVVAGRLGAATTERGRVLWPGPRVLCSGHGLKHNSGTVHSVLVWLWNEVFRSDWRLPMTSADIRPFTIDIPQADLDD